MRIQSIVRISRGRGGRGGGALFGRVRNEQSACRVIPLFIQKLLLVLPQMSLSRFTIVAGARVGVRRLCLRELIIIRVGN